MAFEYDCREGICGSCSLVIDGVPHGPDRGITTCQLYMRRFPDGATITIEPWRAKAFPIIKDLVVDRSAFDRIMQAGGYISVNTGGAVDGNVLLIGKDQAETAMDAASCISCGACVAACKNASATLFVAAKVSHLRSLPQGEPERTQSGQGDGGTRWIAKDSALVAINMSVKPSARNRISVRFIAKLNREFLRATHRRAGSFTEAPADPHDESPLSRVAHGLSADAYSGVVLDDGHPSRKALACVPASSLD